jgi:AraC-like DNA-binding protein
LGFDVDNVRSGVLLSNRQIWRMIRRALRLTQRPDLGLELGRRQNLSHFGLMGMAMITARTFAEAAEIGIRYQRQGGGMLDVTLEVSASFASVVAHPRLRDPSVLPFLVEELFSSMMVLLRTMLGDGFVPQAIELAYPAPAYARRYGEVFGCAVRFGQPRNLYLIDQHWLETPLSLHSPVMAADMHALLEQRERDKDAQAQTLSAIEQVLRRACNAEFSLNEVARALDLSVRTLRRRLTEAGSSFRALRDSVRAQTAQQLLREEHMTVAEVSERLGFSDARAFRRAFKRWVGQTPGPLRRATSGKVRAVGPR